MKKILLYERSVDGHRKKYIENLLLINGFEFFLCAPEQIGVDSLHYLRIKDSVNSKSICFYCSEIAKLAEFVKTNDIQCVHFLDGDSIMRFFGIGFSLFKKRQIIITFHNYYEGKLRKLSYKRMISSNNRKLVVHSDYIKKRMAEIGLVDVSVCEYPAFDFEKFQRISVQKAKAYWKIPEDIPIIGIVGGIASYKGILQFLEVMNGCRVPFHILMCGMPYDITEEELLNACKNYKNKVTLHLEYLNEYQYQLAIAASDIIYCIYMNDFLGASGPAIDGVCMRKMIICNEFGSVGDMTRNNDLGYLIHTKNYSDMLMDIVKAINSYPTFNYGDRANKYRNTLNPEYFRNKYSQIYKSV